MLPLEPHPLPVSHYTYSVAVLNTNIHYVQAINEILTIIIVGTFETHGKMAACPHECPETVATVRTVVYKESTRLSHEKSGRSYDPRR